MSSRALARVRSGIAMPTWYAGSASGTMAVVFKRVVFLIIALSAALNAPAAFGQAERYDRKFFVQLRAVFGRFRDSDLQRVFENARPTPCSELVNDEGEWRTVAFFNEKRELGDWYRRNFDEVKNDFAVYLFKGICRGEHGPVQLTTKFPVTESIEAFSQDRIRFEEVAVNTNAAVRASFDTQTQAYTFDLPYLFLINEQDHERLYSLDPPRLLDRYRYATDVIDHWDCKSVAAENVTYQFLICRTTTLPRSAAERNASRPAFGAAAYFILADGKEASSSVKLSFGDSTLSVPDENASAPPAAAEPSRWEAPDAEEKVLDVLREDFRLRFTPQSWSGRIGNSQVLSAKRMTPLGSARPAEGADYCIWLPGAASSVRYLLSDQPVEYSITPRNQDSQSTTSIAFNFSAPQGAHLGKLECFFPRASSATTIDFRRWTTIVGEHLVLEVKP
jgi:hypothetical protein